MKTNHHQAGAKNSRPVQSTQARKTKRLTPAAAADKPALPRGPSAISYNREQAALRGISREIDPDIPGVQCCEWSDGALLDRVCAAFYDAEPRLAETTFDADFNGVLLIVHQVMHRVRVRGLRPQQGGPQETWTDALPGMQGQMCDDDVGTLCFLSHIVYPVRFQIVEVVITRLSLVRASALADALVILETNEYRNGTDIDAADHGHLTPLQHCSAFLRERLLGLRAHDGQGMSGDLPASLLALGKGGAR